MSQTRDSFKDIDQKIVALLSSKAQADKDMREAVGVLYRDYWTFLDRYLINRYNINREIFRERILNETLNRVMARIETFDPSRAGLRTWMCGIATNVCREMLRKELRTVDIDSIIAQEDGRVRERKKKTRSEIPSEEGWQSTEDKDRDTVSLFSYLLRTKHLDCLEALDPNYRVLIEMVLDGKNKELYKNEFKISDDAYRQRLSRAIKHLRHCIAKKQRLGSAPETEKE